MSKLPVPFGNPYTYPGHSGVDFPQPRGTAFRASGPGVVTWLGSNARGGNFIWVKYDAIGPKVGYHHMDSHNGCPREGARFNEGDRLGYVGSTGNSTGPHLHSEVEGYASTAGYWQFFDASRVVGQGASAPTPSTPSIQSEEDEEMLMLKITAGKSMHYCALGIGVFKHFVQAEPFERVMKVSRARDDWQTIDISELPTFLATYGCDRNIWDFRNKAGKSVSYVDPGALFVVLDPLTKKVASGNTWSAQAAIRAAV